MDGQLRTGQTLIIANSISGVLGTSTSGTIDGYPATLVVQANGNNQDLVLTVTPEPSTLVLSAAGTVGLLGWAWRGRRRLAKRRGLRLMMSHNLVLPALTATQARRRAA